MPGFVFGVIQVFNAGFLCGFIFFALRVFVSGFLVGFLRRVLFLE